MNNKAEEFEIKRKETEWGQAMRGLTLALGGWSITFFSNYFIFFDPQTLTQQTKAKPKPETKPRKEKMDFSSYFDKDKMMETFNKVKNAVMQLSEYQVQSTDSPGIFNTHLHIPWHSASDLSRSYPFFFFFYFHRIGDQSLFTSPFVVFLLIFRAKWWTQQTTITGGLAQRSWPISRTLQTTTSTLEKLWKSFISVYRKNHRRHGARLTRWIIVSYFKFTTQRVSEFFKFKLKALQLLEYLIKNGSERVIDNARDHIYELKALKNFNYVDEKGKDQGINGKSSSITRYNLKVTKWLFF
jgi:hypothetical protein